MLGLNIYQHPGIDSWVQPRLNLGFSWVLNPANLGEPSGQVTQVSWVLGLSFPSLTEFFKTNKKTGFSWVCWVRCQNNKTLRSGFTGFQNPANPCYLGSGTQLTLVIWVQKPSLPSLAGFIKTFKAGFQLGFLSSLPSQQNPQSWVCWVLEPSLRSLAGFIKINKKLGFSQKTRWRSCDF